MKRLRRMKKLTSMAVFLVLSTLIFPFTVPSVMAQATSGGLRGVVTDSTGAVIPDAIVIAKNTATGVENRSKTNSQGVYSFPRLLPGPYLLVIEKDGFKRQEFQEITVNAGQDTTIDGVLQAGLATETITVTAEGSELIQKEQVQISNTFESRKVADLPVNAGGAGLDTIALLAPGIVPGFGNVNSNGTTLSVNGNRARSNNFSIDGQDNNDLSIGGPNYFVNNDDIVQEFQVITNNFSAEYGRNQGAIVNIVTKAGTNQFHGTAFWYHRDQKLFDSLNNIEKRGGQEEPDPFLNNVYGGTLGGPVKRDSIFFFGSYQLVTSRSSALSRATSPHFAPEELGRLKADFPNNTLIQNLAEFSPFGITDFGTLSERTDTGAFPNNETVTIGGRTYRLAYPVRAFAATNDQHQFSIRGDWRINDKHSFWYRHLYQTADNKNSGGNFSGFTRDTPVTSQLGGAQFTSQISNTAVNEFRFVFNRLDVIFGGGCDGLKGCIPHPNDILDTFTQIQTAALRSSITNRQLLTIGPATNLPQGRIVSIYQFNDNFSKTYGRHQLKMGADVRRLTNSVPFLPNVNGVFRYNNAASVTSGIANQFTLASGKVDLQYTETDQFYYFQDDWRIRDNLTLNLGVRYEYLGQPINRLNDVSVETESDPSTALWRQSLPIEARTYPKLDADSNNIAPRLGFAWRPRFDNGIGRWLFGEAENTVISGGYSIAYEPAFYNIMLNISTSAPLVFLDTVTPNFALPAVPIGTAVQAAGQSSGLLRKDTFDPRFLSQTVVSPDFYSPYSQQWSFRVQRELSRYNVFEIRYVGTKGTGLFQTVNGNPDISRLVNGFSAGGRNFPGFPNLVPSGVTPQNCVNDPATPDNEAACNGRALPVGLVRSRVNNANSIYHGLQTRWQANLFNQLNLGMSYTWSKALDNASEIFSFFEPSGSQHPFNTTSAERGYSGFDREHAYSLNFIWDIPGFKEEQGVLGRILGGWQINGTYFLANGQRYTPIQSANAVNLGNATYMDRIWELTFLGALDTLRPFAGNLNAPRTSAGISQIDASLLAGLFGFANIPVANASGFYSVNDLNNGKITAITPDQVRYIFNGPGAATIFGTPFGTGTRGAEMGPRLNQLNLGIFKNVRVKEQLRIQVRGEFFNALNHPAPGVGVVGGGSAPSQNVLSAGSPDGFGDFGGISLSNRVIQLGLRITF